MKTIDFPDWTIISGDDVKRQAKCDVKQQIKSDVFNNLHFKKSKVKYLYKVPDWKVQI